MRNATIADVARAADVSTGTVSHVLSGARNVRPETRGGSSGQSPSSATDRARSRGR